MQGCFVVYGDKENPFDIVYELVQEFSLTTIPENQASLYIELEEARRVIASLSSTPKKRKQQLINDLIGIAQAGLVGETAQPELALKSLHELQKDIVLTQGARIKNTYMMWLMAYALGIAAIFLAFVFFYTKYVKAVDLSVYQFVLFGALTGTWVSFGIRKRKLEFQELSALENDMMNPFLRLIFTCALSLVFLLFFLSGLIEVKLGGITTALLKTDKQIQYIFGVFCGLTESRLSVFVYDKVSKLIE